jgi:hypothetical protein
MLHGLLMELGSFFHTTTIAYLKIFVKLFQIIDLVSLISRSSTLVGNGFSEL